ncbi:MAG: hypothetical protein U0W40_15725 [Acidimicrobiia bacterium]
MSPRRVRFEARVFRGESVAFEPCAGFRATGSAELCHCGWLEDDHPYVPVAAPVPLRVRLPLGLPALARRAS